MIQRPFSYCGITANGVRLIGKCRAARHERVEGGFCRENAVCALEKWFPQANK
jgi:hypothetical protein